MRCRGARKPGQYDKDGHNHASGRRVVFAGDCVAICENCGELVCPVCDDHYADCDCPGPMQDDLYDYTEVDGVLYARPINKEEDA